MSPRSNEGRVERCSLSAQSVVFMLVLKMPFSNLNQFGFTCVVFVRVASKIFIHMKCQ